MLKSSVRRFLAGLGYELKSVSPVDSKCEGFDHYVQSAQSAGMDVNDWLESELGWPDGKAIVEKHVVRHLKSDSVVCEVGSGTGRHAKHIAEHLTAGSLHLYDHSSYLQKFLVNYFRDDPAVQVHQSDGLKIDCSDDTVDLVFRQGHSSR